MRYHLTPVRMAMIKKQKTKQTNKPENKEKKNVEQYSRTVGQL